MLHWRPFEAVVAVAASVVATVVVVDQFVAAIVGAVDLFAAAGFVDFVGAAVRPFEFAAATAGRPGSAGSTRLEHCMLVDRQNNQCLAAERRSNWTEWSLIH